MVNHIIAQPLSNSNTRFVFLLIQVIRDYTILIQSNQNTNNRQQDSNVAVCRTGKY